MKTYGHLRDEHSQRMAEKVKFLGATAEILPSKISCVSLDRSTSSGRQPFDLRPVRSLLTVRHKRP
jgi:hypothetical protein